MTRVLVIDDEDQIRSVLRQMLEREGMVVDEAADGMEAMKIYRDNPADLVITDIIMPEKEGIEIIVELRKNYPDIKIIAMSGGGRLSAENYLLLASRLGADTTLTKPVRRETLIRAIKALIDNNDDKQAGLSESQE